MPTCYSCKCELKSGSVTAHQKTKKHLKNSKKFDYVTFYRERAAAKKVIDRMFAEAIYKSANKLT